MRLAIIEDDAHLREILTTYFREQGFQVAAYADPLSALRDFASQPPDLLILDLMLPGMDGLEVCRLLKRRAETRHLPILVLTARASVAERVLGLESGADDYVTKPFHLRELLARVRALLRRAQPGTVRTQDLEIDLERKRIRRNGQEVVLTPREWALLERLVEARGRPVSREDLAALLEPGSSPRSVDFHVARLRKKLGANVIETVRGLGYRLPAA